MKYPQTFPRRKKKPDKPFRRFRGRAAAAGTKLRIDRICNSLLGDIGTVSCALLVAISLHTKSLGELFAWTAAILAAAGLFACGLLLVKRYAAARPEIAPSLPVGRNRRVRHPGRRRMPKKRCRRGNVISKRRNQKRNHIKH